METYAEITQWLFSQVPVFQQQGASAYKPGLDKMNAFISYLNLSQNSLQMIHVGGTNGKGSTSHMISSCLQELGYNVGLYTSPHLLDFSERIKINNSPINPEFVIDFVQQHQDFFLKSELSFFEITVGMALCYFNKEKVDYAVIEVGLGGRLDATNIITPILSVITNIDLDHTEFLGNTRQAIAFEKAGIIKASVPVVIGEKDAVTAPVFVEKANEVNAPIYFSEEETTEEITTDLLGRYQTQNIKTAHVALQHILSKEELHQSKIGFSHVVAQTGLRGRWEKIGSDPAVIADVTHNAAGFKEVVAQFREITYQQLHLVLGFVKGKDISAIIDLLPSTARFYFCTPAIERGLSVSELASLANEKNLSYAIYDSVDQAYKEAKYSAASSDLIYVGGSTFVIAEILS